MDAYFPDWLVRYEIDPGPGAYDKLAPQLRAALKTQIAMLYKLWEGANDGGRMRHLSDSAAVCLVRPKDWAMFVFAEGYASPAGLIAAVFPALAAGVERIFICRRGGSSPLHPSLSAALELLGQEYVYSLPQEQCASLLQHLAGCGQGGEGCLVCLGQDEGAGELLKQASLCGHQVCALPVAINIALDAGDNSLANLPLLSWLHPDARIAPLAEFLNAVYPDALISDNNGLCCLLPTNKPAPARLVLQPGQECFWLWPGLGPEKFNKQQYAIAGKTRRS